MDDSDLVRIKQDIRMAIASMLVNEEIDALTDLVDALQIIEREI